MSKYYEKSVGNGKKLLYDGSGKCIGRGVTDKSGKTIYSGAGGYAGKSYETGHGTVKYFDSDNNYVGGGFAHSEGSTIHGSGSAHSSPSGSGRYPKGAYVNLSRGNAPSNFGIQPVHTVETAEFNGEMKKVPSYVSLNDKGKKLLFTDRAYAILEKCWEDAGGQRLYEYRITNRLGYHIYQDTCSTPDELIEEWGIDYRKAYVSDLMKYPGKERDFHLTMYDSVINNRTPEYYYEKYKKQRRQDALVIAALCLLGLSILVLLLV